LDLMADDARRRLGLQEARLIGSLTLLSPPPAGMDMQRVAVARHQLALKRLRVVARSWPSIRQALGKDFERVGLEVLAEVPMRERHQAVADGLAIAERCRVNGVGGDAVRLALLDHRSRWTVQAGSLHSRVGPWLGAARLRDAGRIAVAIRLRRTRLWIFPL
jgi:hypothetical protein